MMDVQHANQIMMKSSVLLVNNNIIFMIENNALNVVQSIHIVFNAIAIKFVQNVWEITISIFKMDIVNLVQ